MDGVDRMFGSQEVEWCSMHTSFAACTFSADIDYTSALQRLIYYAAHSLGVNIQMGGGGQDGMVTGDGMVGG